MVRELSKHQGAFLFDCCVFIARFASSSCYSSAKTRIRPVKLYHMLVKTNCPSIACCADSVFSVCEPDNMNHRSPKWVCAQAPDDITQEQKSPYSLTPSSPSKAAKDALNLAVASLPTSLQPLLNHFGQKIITTCCKQYAKESIWHTRNYLSTCCLHQPNDIYKY